jgi:peptide/nickel transport system substrate-binding protein
MRAARLKLARSKAAGTTAVLLALAVSVGSCGSGRQDAPTGPGARHVPTLSPATEKASGGKRGGALTVFSGTDFDSIDPGRAHSKLAYEALSATQRPLFSHRPSALTSLTPDLASEQPHVSADGQTITVQIRRGVRFSPPVNREVTTADVAYAIERSANPHVENQDFRTYFSALRGAARATGGPIPGIATPDTHTIVFHLTTRRATPLFIDALSLPLSAPVPESYAKKYDAQAPSQYGTHQVASGPYMFKSNGAGTILRVGYEPGRFAMLVRNPNWRSAGDFRPAYLSTIEIKIGGNQAVKGREVLTGLGLAQSVPTPEVVRLAYAHYPHQLQISSGVGVEYIALNNKRGPFVRSDTRKAFWAALDRVKLSRAGGEALTTQVASHFLYPGAVGFTYATELLSGRKLPYNEHPHGDAAVSQRYMRHAKYPPGRYTGTHTLRIVGISGSHAGRQAAIVTEALHRLGFRTDLRLVSEASMQSRYCGVPAQEVDVCLNSRSKANFADGQEVLDSAFNGHLIRPTRNENWGQVNDPDLNSSIERQVPVLDGAEREIAWGSVDNGLVGHGVGIPYSWFSDAAIESRNVAGVGEWSNGGAWSFSFTSLREGNKRAPQSNGQA